MLKTNFASMQERAFQTEGQTPYNPARYNGRISRLPRVFGIRPVGRYLLLVLLACLPAVDRAQSVATLDAILGKASPTRATVLGASSTAEGIIVRPDGLILTNLHSVFPGETFKVKITVRENNTWNTKTFEGATVSGVHPKYDLALIKINYPRGDLHVAKLLPKDEVLKTGEKCYALTQGITSCVVNTPRKQVMGLDYVEISGELKKAASGSPVVDSKDRVIGLLTLDPSADDNTGYAIPVQDFNIAQFVPPASKPRPTARNSGTPSMLNSPTGGITPAGPIPFATPVITPAATPIATPAASPVGTPGQISLSEEEAKTQIDSARDKAKAGVEIPAEGLTKPLPEKPDDIRLGFGGTCLVMRFPELMKVGIFDLCQAQFTSFIDIKDPHAQLATGGNLLLIYSKDDNKIEKWNLESGKMDGAINLPPSEQMAAIGMGLLNPKFAVVIRAGSFQEEPWKRLTLLTLADDKFQLPDCVPSSNKRNKRGELSVTDMLAETDEYSRISMDDAGISAVVTGGGRLYLNFTAPSAIEVNYIHLGGSVNAIITSCGSHVIIRRSRLFEAEGETEILTQRDPSSETRPNRICIASVAGFRGFSEVILDREAKQDLLQLRALPGFDVVCSTRLGKEVSDHIGSMDDNLTFASAYVGRAAFINNHAKTITLFSISGKVDTAVTMQAAPGSAFSRKLSVPAGTTVKIENGPPGLIYDAEAQELRWTVPDSQPRGVPVSVILLLTDDKGRASYQVEKIMVP